MPNIFNIYLNSTQKISGNNNDAIYFIDWSSILPRGKYKCSFVFTQTGSNTSSNGGNFENRPALLYFNPGCNSNFLYNIMLEIKLLTLTLTLIYIIVHQEL